MTLPIELDPEEKGNSMSKPSDIPQDIWDEAKRAIEPWLGPANQYRDDCQEGVAYAILAERERCAKLVDQKCEFVLSRQNGKDEAVDLNLRLVAVTLPDLSAAIRKGTP